MFTFWALNSSAAFIYIYDEGSCMHRHGWWALRGIRQERYTPEESLNDRRMEPQVYPRRSTLNSDWLTKKTWGVRSHSNLHSSCGPSCSRFIVPLSETGHTITSSRLSRKIYHWEISHIHRLLLHWSDAQDVNWQTSGGRACKVVVQILSAQSSKTSLKPFSLSASPGISSSYNIPIDSERDSSLINTGLIHLIEIFQWLSKNSYSLQ